MDKTKQDRMNVLTNQTDLNEDEVKQLEELVSEANREQAQKAGALALKAANDEAEAARKEETAAAIRDAVKAEREKFEAIGRRLPSGDAPYQTQYSELSKYDNLDAADLSIAIDFQKALKAKGAKYVDGSDIVVPAAAYKAMSLRVAELKNPDNSEEGRKSVDYVKNAFKAGTVSHIEPTKEAVEAAIKAATDPMYTGGAGIGLEWVGTAYSSEIWRQIRAENQVVKNIPEDVIPDGYASKIWPIEGVDFSWYKTPELTTVTTLTNPLPTVTSSQVVTASKTITVGKMSARGLYTQELTEDSIIAFAPQAHEQMTISGQENLESLFIDGDVETSASKNINAIDTTPASTDYFLILDGFRKLGLITNTANSYSAGGSLVIEDFLKIMQLMGTAGLAGANPAKVGFIVDGNVHYALARLPEVKTKDVNSAATVENGFVSKVWGVSVIPSWQMHKASAKRMANSAGKIDGDTDSNNTLGAFLCVRWDQWKQAYKRRMTLETTRFASSDSWEITAHMRIGLAYRDSEAASIAYNVGV